MTFSQKTIVALLGTMVSSLSMAFQSDCSGVGGVWAKLNLKYVCGDWVVVHQGEQMGVVLSPTHPCSQQKLMELDKTKNHRCTVASFPLKIAQRAPAWTTCDGQKIALGFSENLFDIVNCVAD